MEPLFGVSGVAGLVVVGNLVIQLHTFRGRIKDVTQQFRSMHTDLRSTVTILGKLQAAIQGPKTGTLSLQQVRDEFDPVIGMLMELFKDLSAHLNEYGKIDSCWWQKTKSALMGLDDALKMGRSLAIHKANLTLTLHLTHSDTLSTTNREIALLRRQIGPDMRHALLGGWLNSIEPYASSEIYSQATYTP